jgi:site-specific recombinase XerD
MKKKNPLHKTLYDIYTVSKMITHRNVSTTWIYAELVSAKKRESANKISLK